VLEARGPLRVVSLPAVNRSPVQLLITNEGLAPALLTLSLRADPVVPGAPRQLPPSSDPLLPPGSAPAGSAQGLN
jgi:serine/threonine-protein kinase